MKKPRLIAPHRDRRIPLRLDFSGLNYDLFGVAVHRLLLAALCLDYAHEK